MELEAKTKGKEVIFTYSRVVRHPPFISSRHLVSVALSQLLTCLIPGENAIKIVFP